MPHAQFSFYTFPRWEAPTSLMQGLFVGEEFIARLSRCSVRTECGHFWIFMAPLEFPCSIGVALPDQQ